MPRYNPNDIEPKWQAIWEENKIYQASEDKAKPKKYILEYFPYPSGAAMHVGHVRNYTIGDVVARFARLQGFNVLHPMGWDAFGLPAENYAIKNQVSPRVAIDENTARFKQQLMQMGFSYDWSREIDSTDPKYYRWTQWFFLFLFNKGLAYQQESLQWWCPVDKTVLANEQVENGHCWRCGSEVEKKALKQWFFKITDYADRLLDDLDDLDWSDAIKSMQRNWIGRSQGAEIDFKIDGQEETLKVFTTRPDTLYGVTFMVIAPEHPLIETLTTEDHKQHVNSYLKAAAVKSDIERQETNHKKTGVFSGAYAINPVNNEKVPIWIADYVLGGYGTGAIMAVPAHDDRDYEFAKTFGLDIKPVVEPVNGQVQGDEVEKDAIVAVVRNPKTNEILVLDWGPRQARFGGKMFIGGGVENNEDEVSCAKREIREETGYSNVKHIKSLDFITHSYYLSNVKNKNYYARMRGMLFDLVDDTMTEVQLDEGEKNKFKLLWLKADQTASQIDEPGHRLIFEALLEDKAFHGEGRMINSGPYDGLSSSEVRDKIVADLEGRRQGQAVTTYKIRDWLISRQRYWGAPIPIIHCPKDGAVAVPEDQLPVRLPELDKFEPSGDGRSPLANVADFVNTTCPRCGGPAQRETDTMDGFACSSWYFLRFADPHNDEQPFDKSKVDFWLPVDDYIGGAEHAVMHLLYARFWTKVMYDAKMIDFKEPFKALRNQGMILAPDGAKMSKSKGNTIEPDGLIKQGYGADSIRIMELFIGPWNQSASWSVEGLGGAFRFLNRVWTLVHEFKEQSTQDDNQEQTNKDLNIILSRTIKKVGDDLNQMSFNTAIASLMEAVNSLYKLKEVSGYAASDWNKSIKNLLVITAPFAPHITEELWQVVGETESIHLASWPAYDEAVLKSDTMTIAIQINGKLRGEVEVASDAKADVIIEAAKANDKVAGYLKGQTIRKTIYVPKKLVSFVI